ncbi:MAG: hypothetical protein V3V35_00225 [Dehalococcoidia bacterium]
MLGLFVVLAIAAAFRLALILGHPGYLGVDNGAYLLHAKQLLGANLPAIDFTRPPLAPGWLLVPFIKVLGDDLGLELFAAVGSLVFIPAFWLLARRVLPPWWAVAATAFLLFDLIHAQMLVTGVLPFIAFSFVLLALWAVYVILSTPTLEMSVIRAEAALALSIPAMAFINQTTTGLALIILPVFTGALAWALMRGGHAPSSAAWRRLALFVGLGTVMAGAALPWYMGVSPGGSDVRFPGPLITATSLSNGVVWQALASVPMGLLMLWKGDRPLIRALGAVLLTLGLLNPWQSFDESLMNIFYRSGYFAAVLFYIGAAWAVYRFAVRGHPRLLLMAASSVALGLVMVGYVYQVQGQAGYSDMVTRDTKAALVTIQGREGGVVTNSRLMSLWIAAINGQDGAWTTTVAPPPAYAERSAAARCVLGFEATCSPVAAAQSIGARFVLIDTRYQDDQRQPIYGAPADDPWGRLGDSPWLRLVYQQGTTWLWEIEA